AMQLASTTLPPWIMGGLVLVMAWKLADLSWAFAPQGEIVTAAPPQQQARPAQPSGRQGVDYRSTVGLFGTAAEEPADGPIIDPDTLEVNTDFDLFGIVARTETSTGLAIIAERNGEAQVYAPGENINSRVSLDSVHAHHVVIINGGVPQRLELPREGDAANAPQRRVATPTRRSRTSNRSARASQSPRALVDLSDPAKLTDLIRPQPVFNNGKQVGYRVYPGRKRQQFSQLGLKPGDLITDINGTQLDDPAKGMDIFKTLSTSTQVSVTVQRNGASEVLVLDTQAIASAANSASGSKER
ncbi:MAG: type II secretion system protein GspC, partial [Pseudomonadota bacterium]